MPKIRAIAAALLLTTAGAAPGWAVPSASVIIAGQVASPTTLDIAGLQALPQVKRTESYTAAGSLTNTFTGPNLLGVLGAAGGIRTNPAVKNDLLQTYVIATGTDGYQSVISTGEFAAISATSPTSSPSRTAPGRCRVRPAWRGSRRRVTGPAAATCRTSRV